MKGVKARDVGKRRREGSEWTFAQAKMRTGGEKKGQKNVRGRQRQDARARAREGGRWGWRGEVRRTSRACGSISLGRWVAKLEDPRDDQRTRASRAREGTERARSVRCVGGRVGSSRWTRRVQTRGGGKKAEKRRGKRKCKQKVGANARQVGRERGREWRCEGELRRGRCGAWVGRVGNVCQAKGS